MPGVTAWGRQRSRRSKTTTELGWCAAPPGYHRAPMGDAMRSNHERRGRIGGAATGVVLLALVLGAGPASAATPSVSITSPAAAATVMGTVSVTVAASVGSGDYISSVRLYDGVQQVNSASCQSQPTCTATIKWPATGLSGAHTLTATASTGDGDSAGSAPVLVTVVSPPPTVVITSPTAGSTVAGTIAVTASAATEPSQDDYPTGIRFYDGVNLLGSISCQGQQTCEGSVNWAATGLSGKHTLKAFVSTNESLSVSSTPVEVTVVSPRPTVKITSPAAGAPLGRILRIHVAGATDPTQDDYPTSIAVYDGRNAIGTISCEGQQTCEGTVRWDARDERGAHRLTAIIRSNEGRATRSAGVIVGAATPRRLKPHCELSTSSAAIGALVRGTCSIVGAPKGTEVLIQARGRHKWSTIVTGRVARDGRFAFRLRGGKRATYDLWVAVSPSRSTAFARAHIGTLHITR